MARAQFQKGQKVWVESVGVWAQVEKVMPVWAKGFDEPVRITYDVGPPDRSGAGSDGAGARADGLGGRGPGRRPAGVPAPGAQGPVHPAPHDRNPRPAPRARAVKRRRQSRGLRPGRAPSTDSATQPRFPVEPSQENRPCGALSAAVTGLAPPQPRSRGRAAGDPDAGSPPGRRPGRSPRRSDRPRPGRRRPCPGPGARPAGAGAGQRPTGRSRGRPPDRRRQRPRPGGARRPPGRGCDCGTVGWRRRPDHAPDDAGRPRPGRPHASARVEADARTGQPQRPAVRPGARHAGPGGQGPGRAAPDRRRGPDRRHRPVGRGRPASPRRLLRLAGRRLDAGRAPAAGGADAGGDRGAELAPDAGQPALGRHRAPLPRRRRGRTLRRMGMGSGQGRSDPVRLYGRPAGGGDRDRPDHPGHDRAGPPALSPADDRGPGQGHGRRRVRGRLPRAAEQRRRALDRRARPPDGGGAGRHRGPPHQGPGPGRREPPARRHRKRVRRLRPVRPARAADPVEPGLPGRLRLPPRRGAAGRAEGRAEPHRRRGHQGRTPFRQRPRRADGAGHPVRRGGAADARQGAGVTADPDAGLPRGSAYRGRSARPEAGAAEPDLQCGEVHARGRRRVGDGRAARCGHGARLGRRHRHRHLRQGSGTAGPAVRTGRGPTLQVDARNGSGPGPDQVADRTARRRPDHRKRTGARHHRLVRPADPRARRRRGPCRRPRPAGSGPRGVERSSRRFDRRRGRAFRRLLRPGLMARQDGRQGGAIGRAKAAQGLHRPRFQSRPSAHFRRARPFQQGGDRHGVELV
uniref:Translation initiation factor IF-2 n=1 Tax=Parastrongyloides trichosuri TaxID=131310 RepID=A0A0N4Z1E2_PARTI